MKRKAIIAALAALMILAASYFAVTATSVTLYDPDKLVIKVYSVDIYTDSSDPTGVNLFTNTPGVDIDVINDAGQLFGQIESIPAGEYHMLKLTVDNDWIYNSGEAEVGCTQMTAPYTTPYSGTPGPVSIWYATGAADTIMPPNGTKDYPYPMKDFITVEDGKTTEIDMHFQAAGTIRCPGNVLAIDPPEVNMLALVIEPPASGSCSVGGEYWFTHFNTSAGIYNDSGVREVGLSPEEIFKNTTVIAGWGTMFFNSVDKSVSVYGGNIYNVASPCAIGSACGDPANYPGMAEHRHQMAVWANTPDDRYNNPAMQGSPGELMVFGIYNASGSKMIVLTEGSPVEYGVSDDCNTIVGVNMNKDESDVFYAVKKTITAPTLSGTGIYMVAKPMFEIQYDETGSQSGGVINGTHYLGFNPDILFLDQSTDNYIAWRNMMNLNPTYDGFGNITTWTSRGPRENTEEGTGLNLNNLFTLRQDGFANAVNPDDADSFVVFGKGGLGLIAGGAIENDLTWGQHIVEAGTIMEVATDTIQSDIAGRWKFANYEAKIVNSDAWETGNEDPYFYLSFTDLTVDANGYVTTFVDQGKNVLQDTYNMSSFVGTTATPHAAKLELKTHCYKVGADITAAVCTGGIQIPVFEFYEIDPVTKVQSTERSIYIILDKTKKVASLIHAQDQGGHIYNAPSDGTCQQGLDELSEPTSCGDAQTKMQFGIGVKVK